MAVGRLGLQGFFPGRSSGTRFPWRKAHRALWEARLSAIRDNEHVRHIEQPVYRRRWDEQWKVNNRWMAGRVAYAQEFVDAFRWWLAEKAEWHLEHKAQGGPIGPDAWTVAGALSANGRRAIYSGRQGLTRWRQPDDSG